MDIRSVVLLTVTRASSGVARVAARAERGKENFAPSCTVIADRNIRGTGHIQSLV